MRVFTLFLFLFFSVLAGAIAQKQPLLLDTTLHAGFSWKDHPEDEGFYSNEIIREITKFKLRGLNNTHVKLSCHVTAGADSLPNGVFRIWLRVDRVETGGDIVFRDLPLLDAVLPSQSAVEIEVLNPGLSGEQGLTVSIDFSLINPGTSYSDVLPMTFQPDQAAIRLKNAIFFHTRNDLERFYSRQLLINDYYAGVSLLDRQLRVVAKIQSSGSDSLTFHLIRLEEMKQLLAYLNDQKMEKVLRLDEHDPGSFLEKFMELNRNYNRLYYTFSTSPGTSFLPGSGRPCGWSEIVFQRLSFYYDRSILVGESFAPVYVNFSKTLLNQASLRGWKNLITEFLPKGKAEKNVTALAYAVSYDLQDRMTAFAGKLMKQENFAEAMQVLSDLESYSKINPYSHFNRSTEDLSNSYRGVYRSYLGIANSAIELNKISFAERYLKKAALYRKQNRSFITDSSGLDSAYCRLVNLRCSVCAQKSANHSYAEALDCYHDVASWCNEEKTTSGSKQIRAGKIPVIIARERQFLQLLKKKLQNKDTLGILSCYDTLVVFYDTYREEYPERLLSDSIERIVSIYRYDRFRAKRSSGFLHDLISAEKYIWSDQPDSAMILYRTLKERQEEMGLNADDELNKAQMVFLEKLAQQRCWKNAETVEINRYKTEQFIRQHQYLMADSLWNACLKLSRDFPECKINTQGIGDSLKKYHDAAIYQEWQKEFPHWVGQKDYIGYISRYAKATDLFDSCHLARFGFIHPSLYEAVSAYKNEELARFSLDHFLDLEKCKDALELLISLHKAGFSHQRLSEQIYRTGSCFYGAHLQPEPQFLERMDARDEWFREFFSAMKHSGTRGSH